MILYRTWLVSPILPALLLLFGLTFLFAFTHIFGLSWVPGIARYYYVTVFMWGCFIFLQRFKALRNLDLLDFVFISFLFLITASLAVKYDNSASAVYYAALLPFLVFLPYCLGRLIEKQDFELLLRILPWLGLILLLLCVVDYWITLDSELVGTRWSFFGLNHSPLQIAIVVSSSLISIVYILIKNRNHRLTLGDLIVWGVFILYTIALVVIAARGAFISCTIVLTLMVCLAPRRSKGRKLLLLGYFTGVAMFAFYILPKSHVDFYLSMSKPYDYSFLDSTIPEHRQLIDKIKANPKCRVIIEAVNSLAIRRLLYSEAIELFTEMPWTGVGATRFGYYSCAGPGSYPHSSILQAFAELGLLGGGVIMTLFIVSTLILFCIYFFSPENQWEAFFWISLLCFFALSDQIYGNYFMASGSFFMFGVSRSFQLRFQQNSTKV